MRLIFYDGELNRIAEEFTCQALSWKTHYNDVGNCLIAFNKSNDIRSLVNNAKYVKLAEDDTSTLMILTGFEELRQTIILHGKSCLWILGTRNAYYPKEYLVENDKPSAMIWRSVYFAFDNDAWGFNGKGTLIANMGEGIGEKQNYIFDSDNLLKQVLDIAQKNDIGLKIEKVGNNLELNMYQPPLTETPFYEKFGNVYDVQMLYSENDYVNRVQIVSEDINEQQKSFYYGVTPPNGFDLREGRIEVSRQDKEETAEQHTARMMAEGSLYLQEHKKIEELSFRTDKPVSLGQQLKVVLDSLNMTVQTRCMSKEFRMENNTIKTDIVVGEITRI